MPKTYSKIWIHLIWATRDRSPALEKSFRIKLFKHLKNAAEEKGFHLDIINGVEDHVHCLVGLNPSQNISGIVQYLKGNSSHWINKKGFVDDKFSWQSGYNAFSVSPDNVYKVRNYIDHQIQHHSEQGFREEIDSICKIAQQL